MDTLVFVETNKDNKAKQTSLEAVVYAHAMGGKVTVVVIGTMDEENLANLGKHGANKVCFISDKRLDRGIVQAYTTVLFQVIEQEKANIVILSSSLLGTHVAARLAARLKASFASNVVDVPDTTSGFVVKQSIYTGKAFAFIALKNEKKIIAIKKNTISLKEVGGKAEVVEYNITLTDADFNVKVTSVEEGAGEILLPEAEIIVSGGRGMKGQEHWGMLEDLAKVLGAALGCSKPVSDMGWRPHHEHVGQTGVKVAPQLYIAVGISGAIQHLAGVNSSKCIVVINKDAEAPFFKSADYGIVGDAFEIIPKLTKYIKANSDL